MIMLLIFVVVDCVCSSTGQRFDHVRCECHQLAREVQTPTSQHARRTDCSDTPPPPGRPTAGRDRWLAMGRGGWPRLVAVSAEAVAESNHTFDSSSCAGWSLAALPDIDSGECSRHRAAATRRTFIALRLRSPLNCSRLNSFHCCSAQDYGREHETSLLAMAEAAEAIDQTDVISHDAHCA
jgi:hypothetical protein